MDVGGGAWSRWPRPSSWSAARGTSSISTISKNVVVTTDERGTPVLLRDIADVRLGPELRRGIAELNGEGEAVGGIIVMRYGENALKTIENVKKKLERAARPACPRGSNWSAAYDRSRPDRAGGREP